MATPPKQLRTLGATIASALGDELSAAQKSTLIGKLNASLPADQRLLSRAEVEALIAAAVEVTGVAPSLITFVRLSVPENEPAGFAVGTPSADGSGLVTITLVNDAGGAFELVDGELRTTAALDYEAGATRTVRLRAGNAIAAIEADFAIALTDVPAPVAAGALADRTFTQGAGVQTVSAAGDFTNTAGAVYSVAPAWLSIDAATGVVSIPTDTLRAAVAVTVTCTTAEGAATSGFQVTVEVAGEPITEAVHKAVTVPITGGSASSLVAYETGRVGIVVGAGGTVTLDLDAAVHASGETLGGAMLNLARTPAINSGADEVHAFSPDVGGYDAGLAVTGEVTMSPGDVLILAVRRDMSGGADPRQGQLHEPFVAVCLASAPAVPAGSALISRAPIRGGDVASAEDFVLDLDAAEALVLDHQLPTADLSSYSGALLEDFTDRFCLDFAMSGYFAGPDNNAGYQSTLPYQTGKGGTYGRDMAWMQPSISARLRSTADGSVRRRLLTSICQRGIDEMPMIVHPPERPVDGYHHIWRVWFALMAAKLLGRADLRALIEAGWGGHIREAYDYLTEQDVVDITTPHSSAAKSYLSRLREVTRVEATAVFARVDQSLGDLSKMGFSNASLVCPARDLSYPIASHTNPDKGDNSQWDAVDEVRLELGVAHGVQAGDFIACIAAGTPRVGQVQFFLDGKLARNSMRYGNSPYLTNQAPDGFLLAAGALGMADDPFFDLIRSHVFLRDLPDYPTAEADMIDGDDAVFNFEEEAILASVRAATAAELERPISRAWEWTIPDGVAGTLTLSLPDGTTETIEIDAAGAVTNNAANCTVVEV